jgi:inorganic pyrophosphatase
VVESYVKSKDATKKFDLPKKSDIKTPKERPARYDKWFYLDDNFEPLPEQEIDVD